MKVEISTEGKFGLIYSEPFDWQFEQLPILKDCISIEDFIKKGIEFTFEDERDEKSEILNKLLSLKSRIFLFIGKEKNPIVRLLFY